MTEVYRKAVTRSCFAPLAHQVEHLTPNQKVGGSSPSGRARIGNAWFGRGTLWSGTSTKFEIGRVGGMVNAGYK